MEMKIHFISVDTYFPFLEIKQSMGCAQYDEQTGFLQDDVLL